MLELDINSFISIFKNKLGNPDSESHLIQYLEFLLNYNNMIDCYCENHHILPRAQFKEYVNIKNNMVKLAYVDHIKAHELLAAAYANRTNLRTLNYMKSDMAKNSELISLAAKKGWATLKSDKEKYDKFKKSRSKYMKELSDAERSRRANKYWKNITDADREKRCKINGDNWTDELKARKSKQMREYFKNNPSEASKRLKTRYDNMSDSDFQILRDKMSIVNKDLIKREKAGIAIKKLWQDDNFKKKMKTRKTTKRTIIAIDPNGKVFERYGLIEMVAEFDFSPYLVRKFNNTGNKVVSTNSKNKQVQNTIGWTFNFKSYNMKNKKQ